MFEFEKIAEERIRDAVNRGELSDLPGQGRPLSLDDDALVPAELRLAYRILKNAGYVPEEVRLRRQIFNLEQALVQAPNEAETVHAMNRLDFLRAKLASRRGYQSGYQVGETYRKKLVASLATPRSGCAAGTSASGGAKFR